MQYQKNNRIQSEICVLVGIKSNLINGQHKPFIHIPDNVSPSFDKQLSKINDQYTKVSIEMLTNLIQSKRDEVKHG